ncbi:MAG: hypothetical protein ACE5GL_00140 [Calditrichia bacterium]
MKSEKIIKMARLVKRQNMDRSFDIEFWQKAGPQAIFEAAWQMVVEYAKRKGITTDELRLDRSTAVLKRKQR